MNNLGRSLNDQELDEMIREVDKDSVGLINYEKIIKMLLASI